MSNKERTGAKKRPAIAGRLKRTAQAAGYTSETIAERLGITAGAVRNWWVGRNEPSLEMLDSYAKATGVSVSYLVSGGEVQPYVSERERRLRMADLIAQGANPIEAMEKSFEDVPEALRSRGWEITEDQRALLAGAGDAMRQELERASGGQWALLSPEQKEAVLRVILAMTPEATLDEPQL